MKKSFLIITAVLVLLASCTSFPEKTSTDDAMVLIPIVFDKSNPGNVFGSFRVKIADQTGDIVASTKLSTSADYKYIPLPPGKYAIVEKEFVYDEGRTSHKEELNIPFELEPGSISVLQQFMFYSFYTNIHKANTYFMWGEFVKTDNTVISNVQKKLREEPASSSWNIVYP